MRELSEATMDRIEWALVDHTHALVSYCDPRVPEYRLALAEFREWREYMAQRASFARGNVAIDRDPDARRTVAVEGDDGAGKRKGGE